MMRLSFHNLQQSENGHCARGESVHSPQNAVRMDLFPRRTGVAKDNHRNVAIENYARIRTIIIFISSSKAVENNARIPIKYIYISHLAKEITRKWRMLDELRLRVVSTEQIRDFSSVSNEAAV